MPCPYAIRSLTEVKLILRIGNIWPLFLALLILGTAWKVAWHHVGNKAPAGSWLSKLAGAALYQTG